MTLKRSLPVGWWNVPGIRWRCT